MKRLALILCAVLLPGSARATTVDFNAYAHQDTGYLTSVSYQGLTFTRGNGALGVWDGNSPNSNGTPALIYGYGSPLTITSTVGGVFNLKSLEMAISWYDDEPTGNVNVVAHSAGGGLIAETLSLIQGIQKYSLNFADVSSVMVFALPRDSGYWLMDNVNFSLPSDQASDDPPEQAPTVTPEPGSWFLLGTGMLGLAVLVRQKMTA